MKFIGNESYYEFLNKGDYIEFNCWVKGANPPSKGSYAQTRVTRRVFNPCAKSVYEFKNSFLSVLGRSSKTSRPDAVDLAYEEVILDLDILGYYWIDLAIVKSRPRSHYTSKGVLTKKHKLTKPTSKPDNDKTERAIWDIIVNEGLMIDDSRILRNSACKMWVGESYNDVIYTDRGIGVCLKIF